MTTILLSGSLGTGGYGTFTKPANIRKITVEGWGAGGSGSKLYRSGSGQFTLSTGGGAGGAYAKSIAYYPPIEQTLDYYVATAIGVASASIWYGSDNKTPVMIAMRGGSGPTRACLGINGTNAYDCTEDIDGNPYEVPSGTISGSLGNVIVYKGGSGTTGSSTNTGCGGGGGAGSTGDGQNAPTTTNFGGTSTIEFGGSGSSVKILGGNESPAGLYGGGGGGFLAQQFGSPTYDIATYIAPTGSRGLIRITLSEEPPSQLPSKIQWNNNTLFMEYALDNSISYSTTIDGSEAIRIENGTEYSWIPNTNYIMEGDVRWIPTTSTATQTGWDGGTGWRAFLEYARAKNKFIYYYNAKDDSTGIESYLVEPLNGQHELEIDGTRRIRLVIRNTTTPYTGY